MEQNLDPAPETPGEGATGKHVINPGTSSRDGAGAPERNDKEPSGTPGPQDRGGVTVAGIPAEELDLSPAGLKDSPAQEVDEESLVDPGNS
ncbi:MAG: hypothetical protein NVS2B15_03350 [Pseudarthrobacter sp.]